MSTAPAIPKAAPGKARPGVKEKVIEQPFIRRCDVTLFAHRLFNPTISVEQRPAVILQSAVEPSAFFRPRGNGLSFCEGFRVLFEALNAEELAADQLFRVRREHRCAIPEEPLNKYPRGRTEELGTRAIVRPIKIYFGRLRRRCAAPLTGGCALTGPYWIARWRNG